MKLFSPFLCTATRRCLASLALALLTLGFGAGAMFPAATGGALLPAEAVEDPDNGDGGLLGSFRVVAIDDDAPAFAVEYAEGGEARALFNSEGVIQLSGPGLRISFEGATPVPPALFTEASSRAPSAIVYRGLYPGVDIWFKASHQGVKYELQVAPGGALGAVRLRYESPATLAVDPSGNLLIGGAGESRVDPAPVSFDGLGSPIACSFNPFEGRAVGFSCPGWNLSRSLTIDPVLFGSYLGGSGVETATHVGIDQWGNLYFVGTTNSTDFFTLAAFDSTYNGASDIFVTKVDPRYRYIYSTFLGGSKNDDPRSVYVSPEGRVYIAGGTTSPDFPVTQDALDSSYGASYFTAFVLQLDTDGSLAYSTYLGGSNYDGAYALAVDTDGAIFVAGAAGSPDFPVTPGGPPSPLGGGYDAFIAKIDANTRALNFSFLFGGSRTEVPLAVVLDPRGDIIIAGATISFDFPTTPDALDTAYNGTGRVDDPADLFVTRLSGDGRSVRYSTYYGGDKAETVKAAALGPAGDLFIAGDTNSRDFPTTAGAFQEEYNWDGDLFVLRLLPNQTGLGFATYIGGDQTESATAMVVDAAGDVYLTGSALEHYPVTPGAYKSMLSGRGYDADAFITKLNSSGDALIYSSYFGTWYPERGASLALDAEDHVILLGTTSTSVFFPITWDAFDRLIEPEGVDGFVVSLDILTFAFEVRTDPPGSWVRFNEGNYPTPWITRCPAGTVYTLSAPSPQTNWTRRYVLEGWSDGGAPTHNVTCTSDLVLTAKFRTEYQVQVIADPNYVPLALWLTIDNKVQWPPLKFWWTNGSSHAVEAPLTQVMLDAPPGYRWRFSNWSDGGGQPHSVTVGGAFTLVARYVVEVLVGVTTDPPGLALTVDGQGRSGYNEYWWEVGSHHTANASDSTPLDAGHRLAFVNWSDGAPHDRILRAMQPTTFVASFVDEYFVSVTTSPGGLPLAVDRMNASQPYEAWWRAGEPHEVAVPTLLEESGTRHTFSHWDDGGKATHVLAASSVLDLAAHFSTEYRIVVDTSPSALTVVVEGSARTAPASFWWPQGSTHEVAVSSPLHIAYGSRFAWDAWSDGEPANHTVTADGPLRLTASFVREYLVTVHGSPTTYRCDRTGCWYPEGATARVDVDSPFQTDAATRWVLVVWQGWPAAANGTLQVVLDGPLDVTTTWSAQFFVSVASRFGSPSGSGWYGAGSIANVSISPTETVENGIAYRFAGWHGASSGEPSLRVPVLGPVLLEAVWEAVPPATGPPGAFEAVAAGILAAVAVTAFLLRRRRARGA